MQKIGIQKYSVSRKEVKGYVTKPNLFLEKKELFLKIKGSKAYPLKIGFHFVRDSKRNFDFHNAVQIIADLMVAHDFIEDDDMNHFLPFPILINNQYFTIDKNNPGVFIKIL